jgi:hypothetical protein
MAFQFLAALLPLLKSAGGAALKGAGAAAKFGAAHPRLARGLLGGAAGGILGEVNPQLGQQFQANQLLGANKFGESFLKTDEEKAESEKYKSILEQLLKNQSIT